MVPPTPQPDATSSKSQKPRSAAVVGMLMTLSSTLAFSTMALLVHLLGPRVPSFQTTSIRFFVQAACSVAAILYGRRGKLALAQTWLGKPENRWLMFSRAACGAVGMSSYFFGLSYPGARLGDVVVIVFLNVPLTALFARIFLKEPFGLADAATTVLAMGGVVLIAQPPALFGAGEVDPVPPVVIITSLVGAVASAFAYLSIRMIGPKEDTLTMVLWFSGLGCLVGPIASLVFQQQWVLADGPDATALAAIGFLGYLGQLLLNRGIQIAPAGPAVLMRYADVVFSLIFQATLLHSPPNALKLLGCACIMSVIVSAYLQAQRKARAKVSAAKAAAAEGLPSSVAAGGSSSAGIGAGSDATAAAALSPQIASGGASEKSLQGRQLLGGAACWDTSQIASGAAALCESKVSKGLLSSSSAAATPSALSQTASGSLRGHPLDWQAMSQQQQQQLAGLQRPQSEGQDVLQAKLLQRLQSQGSARHGWQSDTVAV